MHIPDIVVVFRSYAKKPELVPEVVARAQTSARLAAGLMIVGQYVFQKIVFLVPTDYDCGETANAISAAIKSEGDSLASRVVVYGAEGHHSCGALNELLALLLLADQVSHVAIVSNKAGAYMTPEIMRSAFAAIASGAKVVGVAMKEMEAIVLSGRVQNTFAVWDLEALADLDVPGFDNEAGVEEIAPLIRLVRKYGKCIAVLESSDGKLDIRKSDDGKARHEEVMTTKVREQENEALRLGTEISFIQTGLMEGYPRKV